MLREASRFGTLGLGRTRERVKARIWGASGGTVEYIFHDMHKTVLFEKSLVLGWVFAFGFSEPATANMR